MGATLHALDMNHLRTTLSLLLLLSGCAAAHDPEPPPVDPIDPEPIGGVQVIVPPISAPAGLDACLEAGGALTPVASVNNDDVTEHGDLNTLAVHADGRIAVASADGTIKMWTVEDGFLGQLATGQILYGPELGATPAADLLFHDGWVVSGDVRGLVTAWTLEGDMQIWGGTDPDISIVAIAYDAASQRLAHADTQAGGHVMVRALADGGVVGPLATELGAVRDLAFLADGSLLLGGSGLELRAPGDPTMVTARIALPEVSQVAVAEGVIAAAGPTFVGVLDETLSPAWQRDVSDHAPIGVVLTTGGAHAISAGADGSLRVFRTSDGEEIGAADVADPVVIRAEPTGRALFVGSREGLVHVFECR
jgi:WD40 repeat protein